MKKRLFRLAIFLLILVSVYTYIPSVVYHYYRSITTDEEIELNADRYNELALKIHKSYVKNKEDLKRKEELSKWFHIRGFSIDDGCQPLTTTERWIEIFEYYKL